MDKSKLKKYLFASGTTLLTLGAGSTVFASGGDSSSSVVSALQSTASEITSTMASIGPVALGIAGTFLVWRYGMRFFKSISK